MQKIDYSFCVWIKDEDERDTLFAHILSPKINWGDMDRDFIPNFRKPPVKSFGICALPNGEEHLMFGWYETPGYMANRCGEELSVGEFLQLIADFDPDVSALKSLMDV